MRLQSDQASSSSTSLAAPSNSLAGSSTPIQGSNSFNSNGHSNGTGPTTNGFSNGLTNGTGPSNSTPGSLKNGVIKHNKNVAHVSLPGRKLFSDSNVDREEFVRLVVQSLRDVGYIESAATLEAESGYTMESTEVAEFRNYVMEASWEQAEAALIRLGVTDEDNLMESRFLISQQKYLELLENRNTTAALMVLRNELAPHHVDPEHLYTLSSLIMCSTPEDLRHRAGWDGSRGNSRTRLLSNLQKHIPSAVMIPQRRFLTLLEQSRLWQQQRCPYHNSPPDSMSFSLYRDHHCDSSCFPNTTTTILEIHTDEVWNIEWSHSGEYLASAGKDKSAIIWRVGPEKEPAQREYTQHLVLRDHQYPVGCISWSLDDSILFTSSENHIKMWNTRSGLCMRTIETHTETVTAIRWLPDNSGFMSAGLDRRILIWDPEGNQRDSWGMAPIRVTDLDVSPNMTKVVAVGVIHLPPIPHPPTSTGNSPAPGARGDSASQSPQSQSHTPSYIVKAENRMIVYDLATKHQIASLRLDGETTSVRVSRDSRYALISHAPDEVLLWDLSLSRIACKYTGQKQGRHVIRSCYGGVDGNFVASGSEDGNVYVWHRDSGALLEVLSGHGEGSVNAVAWNPTNEWMFASCSDDKTIRIWEAVTPGMLEAAAASTPADKDTVMSDSASVAGSSKNEKGKGKVTS
ncbi:WD40 repeat-like protein [Thelephora terrestris]|uniref:WD40 repeat-like protein n=1 Tax=Thelephora terrestris TaxID=56493 RepID=A0A9P6HQ10_9AGAM|nr:WD40 repeat-like protein [Thelephora terrestris]